MKSKQAARRGLLSHLLKLHAAEDRGALAALRHSLRKPPGADPRVFQTLGGFLPAATDGRSRTTEYATFLVAGLFALHPDHSDSIRNFGETMKRIGVDNPSAGLRFRRLIASSEDGLHVPLRQAVRLAKSHAVAVNYDALIADVQRWGHPDAFVQKNWARSYWTVSPTDDPGTEASARRGP